MAEHICKIEAARRFWEIYGQFYEVSLDTVGYETFAIAREHGSFGIVGVYFYNEVYKLSYTEGSL